MPVGIQRINAKKSQPNPRIVFIKPLPGHDEKVAQDFLERIAAQCLPVMRDNLLSVMTLEEYEPNREFVGRNFNGGEVIQLVLKSPRTHRWLPFEYVQMVMMHELAHCKHMNHSRAFWSVRNRYAEEMYALWRKGYLGDGIWGRGARLRTGEWERQAVSPEEVLPENLCGGTYRSKRKRKAKQQLTYQERKERRILKKFGRNGVALGANEREKVKLEKGKKKPGKPRVAGSARGRELRAAAALARFDKQKVEEEEDVDLKAETDDDETASGSESEFEDEVLAGNDATDIDGTRMQDKHGRGMVKVCEDEDADDPEVKNELDELRDVFTTRKFKRESPEVEVSLGSVPEVASSSGSKSGRAEKKEARESRLKLRDIPAAPKSQSTTARTSEKPAKTSIPTKAEEPTQPQRKQPTLSLRSPAEQPKQDSTCAVCSFANESSAMTCMVCANVLDPAKSPGSWKCQSGTCKGSKYVNAADCGVCGVCGQRREGNETTKEVERTVYDLDD